MSDEDAKEFFSRILRGQKSETTSKTQSQAQTSQPAYDPSQGLTDDRPRKQSAGHMLFVEVQRGLGRL